MIRFRRITHTLAYNPETCFLKLSYIVTARVIQSLRTSVVTRVLEPHSSKNKSTFA